MTDEGARSLAAAIIETACKDYLQARKGAEFSKDDYKRRYFAGQYNDLLRFFRGGWFGLLSDMDPDVVLAELDRQFNEYAATRRRRK